jgi:DNA-binding CsgD family transcriptional regulator
MLETWHIDAVPRSHTLSASAVALLLEAAHDAAPAARILDFLNVMVPVDYLSLVQYTHQGGMVAPTLVEGHASQHALSQVTVDCFSIYRRHFWREDQGTQIAQNLNCSHGAATPVTALHLNVSDIACSSWRTQIYDHARLADRLSFFYSPLPDTTYAINLYRGTSQGVFRQAEIQQLLALSPLLRQTHRGALLCKRTVTPGVSADQRIALASAALQRKVPALSARELAVCARIACGISADGIAADLDVAPSTIITLRKRAYAKLAGGGLPAGRLHLANMVHL